MTIEGCIADGGGEQGVRLAENIPANCYLAIESEPGFLKQVEEAARLWWLWDSARWRDDIEVREEKYQAMRAKVEEMVETFIAPVARDLVHVDMLRWNLKRNVQEIAADPHYWAW